MYLHVSKERVGRQLPASLPHVTQELASDGVCMSQRLALLASTGSQPAYHFSVGWTETNRADAAKFEPMDLCGLAQRSHYLESRILGCATLLSPGPTAGTEDLCPTPGNSDTGSGSLSLMLPSLSSCAARQNVPRSRIIRCSWKGAPCFKVLSSSKPWQTPLSRHLASKKPHPGPFPASRCHRLIFSAC